MKVTQAVLHGAGDLRLDRVEIDVAPDGLVVNTLMTALSTGTDMGNWDGRSLEVPGAPPYPRWVGYSNVGYFDKTPDTRVFSMKPHQSRVVLEPDDVWVPVPNNVSNKAASLTYLAQLGLAALQKVSYQPGEYVGVVGLGVIGLCTVAVARALGAHVVAIGNAPERLRAAARCGAHDVTDYRIVGATDLMVLTANTWDAYRSAVEQVRDGGRVAVLGFPGRNQPAPPFNPVQPEWLYAKQLTIAGAGRSDQLDRNLFMIMRLMEQGDLDLEPAISHVFPWRKMKDAYELAASRDKRFTAAVFDWTA